MRSVRELMQAVLDEPALTVDETAVLLSLSRHSAYEGVKSGEVPSIRVGRIIRVPCAGLRTMLGIERREPSGDTGHFRDQGAKTAASKAKTVERDEGARALIATKAARPATRPPRKTTDRETTSKSNKQQETEIA